MLATISSISFLLLQSVLIDLISNDQIRNLLTIHKCCLVEPIILVDERLLLFYLSDLSPTKAVQGEVNSNSLDVQGGPKK